MPSPSIKIWDRPVRLMHWLLVVAIAIAWLSGHSFVTVKLHEPAGYVALVIVVTRIIWGFVGSRYARFAQFVRGPRAIATYMANIIRGHEARYVGHNPLGAWMIVALLASVVSLGATGWLYTTDAFWGEPWLDMLHQSLAWFLLALIALHIAGVVFTSLRHRENLISAMLTGRKKAPEGNDVA